MKTCPFCREEVRDEAIKCRYCSSSLQPPQDGGASAAGAPAPAPNQVGGANAAGAPAPAPNQVVYVLDKDLIRFTKFAVAILAIFATVGVFLWGFDIKEAAKDAQASAKDAQASAKDVRALADDMRKIESDASNSKTNIQQMKDDVANSLSTFKASLLEAKQDIDENKRQLHDLIGLARKDEQKLHSMVVMADPGADKDGSFSVPELLQLYDFPADLDGSGQCIGLIELGGGYRESDLNTYFTQLKLPTPKVTVVSVDGAKNSPGDPVDAQVTLDLEVAGAVAPRVKLVIYFAPNTNQGLLNAVNKVIDDTDNRPSILAVSWGEPEAFWTKELMATMNLALQRAAKKDITVLCAAGDAGVVDFPASSPWVTCCGGTHLVASGKKISSETAYNYGTSATGGGVSDAFAQPDWQSHANVPARKDGGAGRGVPDVAANADPESGYRLFVQGQFQLIGGTTAASSFWAGSIALINQGVGHNVGYINPVLYTKLGPAGVLRGVKGCSAGTGWNPCTGWGSPDGKKLVEAFRSSPMGHD